MDEYREFDSEAGFERINRKGGPGSGRKPGGHHAPRPGGHHPHKKPSAPRSPHPRARRPR